MLHSFYIYRGGVIALLLLAGLLTASCSDAPADPAEGADAEPQPIRIAFAADTTTDEPLAAGEIEYDGIPSATAFFTFWSVNGNVAEPDATVSFYFDLFMDANHTIDRYENDFYNTGRYYPDNGQYIIAYAFGSDVASDFIPKVSYPSLEYPQTHTDASTGLYGWYLRSDSSALRNSDWEYVYRCVPNGASTTYRYDLDVREKHEGHSGRFVFRHVTTKLRLWMWRSEEIAGDAPDMMIHDIRVYAPVSTVPNRLSWNVQVGFFADSYGTTDADPSDLYYAATDCNFTCLYSLPEGAYDEILRTGRQFMTQVCTLYLDLDDYALHKYQQYLYPGSKLLDLIVVAKYGDDDRLIRVPVQITTVSYDKSEGLFCQGEVYDLYLALSSDTFTINVEQSDWSDGENAYIGIMKPSTGS